ncbi:hypothetical protein FA95DRAFT_1536246 [Auriscalpium vulgare]|uniref:Uncharacterized protein n=1 Tax=Auriscalpium vulgare TaxID=40419 RepID=A0ACB8S2U1_9AGAM|nr:hypothetical protein FA95DRAFT_1536246 [Auriscalpium vulgare]
MPVQPNAHPESEPKQGQHSDIPRPPPEHDPAQVDVKKDIPDTGWTGPVPSRNGGSGEGDFMNKPPYFWNSEGDKFTPKYVSECWCGNVKFEVHGDPLDAKHCHCKQCQGLHGAPFQWAVIFPKTSVRLVRNENNSLHFFSTEKRKSEHHVPVKVSCDTCRSPLFDEGRQTVLAYPSSFHFPQGKVPTDFQPTCHIFYAERVLEVPDGIPKWEGHKGASRLMQELSADQGIMPKYKGHSANGGTEAKKRKVDPEEN